MKEKFDQLISESVKHFLKDKGFSKKALSFYRKENDLVFVINFQKSRDNIGDQTKFYINCGIHSITIDKMLGKEPRSEPKEYECYFRHRISWWTTKKMDGDYHISSTTDIRLLATIVLADLNMVLEKFDNCHSTENLLDFYIDSNGHEYGYDVFEYLLKTSDKVRLKNFVAMTSRMSPSDLRWRIAEKEFNRLLKDYNYVETAADLINS